MSEGTIAPRTDGVKRKGEIEECQRRASARRPHRQLLYAPVPRLSDVDLVFIPAIDGVDRPEFLQLLAGPTELAQHLSIEIDFIDVAVDIEIVRGVRIRHIKGGPSARRDADRPRGAHIAELSLERTVSVEHLNATIAAIGDVETALCVEGETRRHVELAGLGSALTPVLEIRA